VSEHKVRYSVLVPIYCEAESLVELCERVAQVFSTEGHGADFEIVLVDDGSTDATPGVIDRLTSERPYVRAVTLRRNCGKSLALSAGFRHVRGAFIVTLDGDLQDQPEDIPRLLAAVETDCDMVNGWRIERFDTPARKLGSRLYNWFVRRTTGLRLHDMNCAVKAYRAELVQALSVYGQYHRYIPLQAHLAGFKVTEMPVTNRPRRFGSSKFRTFRYEGFFDLLSLLFLNKYGLSPMHFFGTVSAGIIVPSLVLLGYFTVEGILYWFGHGQPVFNRPLLSLSLTALMLGGMIFTTGFVCDFFLHHMIRSRLDGIIAMSISKVSGGESARQDAIS
jgi:glycosyltransferase involved in cell wall biosynthesis